MGYTTKEAKRAAQLQFYRKRRAHFIEYLGGRCVDCFSKKNLEFDHKNPKAKNFDPSKCMSYAYATVKAEIDKCVLRCDRCHVEKTKSENGRAEHGKVSMYRHYGCRCDLCKAANREQVRKWRKKKLVKAAALKLTKLRERLNA